jgi:hypothetical protein
MATRWSDEDIAASLNRMGMPTENGRCLVTNEDVAHDRGHEGSEPVGGDPAMLCACGREIRPTLQPVALLRDPALVRARSSRVCCFDPPVVHRATRLHYVAANGVEQYRQKTPPHASTSTGRLMIAVLGGLADVERDLIRTRTAEGRSRRRSAGWADPRNSPMRRRPRPGSGGLRARRLPNSRAATGESGANPSDADVLRRHAIRNERGGYDPTGASEETGRFAHDPLQASPVADGDDHAEGTKGRKRPTDVIDAAIIDAGEGEPKKRC